MDETILSRVDVGRQPYFLQTTLLAGGTEGLRLILTDALNAWSGEIVKSEIVKLAKNVSMETSEFIEQSKKALTLRDVGNLTFEYQVTDLEDGGKQFSWKKVMTTGNIKFQLGSVDMEPMDDPSESIQDLLIFSVGHVDKLREDIRRLEMENERLSTERSNALKFQIVLNDKKLKIRALKEEAKDAKDQVEDAKKNSDDTPQQPGTSIEGANHSSDDEERMDMSDGEDTDDERKKSQAVHKKRTRIPASTAPAQSGDSDLLLGEDEEDQPTTSKRRRRREPQRKEDGPQKPAVPRVPSNTTPARATPTQQRSRTSGRSRPKPESQPDKEAEAEELFADL